MSSTYKAAIHAFYEKRLSRYLQSNSMIQNWAFLADQTKREALLQKGIDPKEMAHICREIINNALEDKPEDLTITTHICRGNHASSVAVFSVDMNPIAEKSCSQQIMMVSFFGIRRSSDRAGDFTFPFKTLSNKESKVVLGLVTSKFPDLEDTGRK